MKPKTVSANSPRRCAVSPSIVALWLALALSVAGTARLPAATRTWTGGSATSGNWSTGANWSGGVAPSAGDVLQFVDSGARKASNTNNFAAGTTFSVINCFGNSPYRLRGNRVTITNSMNAGNPAGGHIVDLDITLGGPEQSVSMDSFDAAASLTINGDVNLGSHTLLTDGAGDITIAGVITGTGGVFKNNPGTLSYVGLGANTYSGQTTIGRGILRLNRYNITGGLTFVGATAIAGDLSIGDFVSTLIGDIVVLDRDNQIANTSTVFVNATGSLELSDENDTVGELRLRGGTVTTGTGSLGVEGGIYATLPLNVSKDSLIAGRLSLGARGDEPQIIDVAQGVQLNISAQISGVSTADLIKTNRGELVLTSSNIFNGDVVISGGTVTIRDGHALGTTNGVTRPALGTLAIAATIGIPETLEVPGPSGSLVVSASSLSASWIGPVVLDDDLFINVPTNSFLTIVGQISGPAGWTKVGDGTLQFKTPYTNSYAGASWVREGNFIMDGVFNQPVIPGPFIIGNATDPTNSTRAWPIKQNQIADNAPVTVNRSGVLQLGFADDTIGPLTFNGGAVETDDGILTLNGDILANATNQTARISGNLALGGVTRTIYTLGASNTPDLLISAVISDGGAAAGFNKIGEGTLELSGANVFNGPASVTDGTLRIAHPNALGSTAAGTSISGIDGPRIIVEGGGGGFTILEPLTLNSTSPGSPVVLENFIGNNHWNGPIALIAPESVINVPSIPRPLSLGGAISGPGGIKKIGAGPLTLDGPDANAFAGTMMVSEGSLLLSKPNGITAVAGNLIVGDGLGGAKADVVRLLTQHQIGDLGEVTVADSGWLDCNNRSEGLGSLAGQGSVTMGGGFLSLGSNNLSRVFSGVLSNTPGANGMVKIGSGAQTFSGNNLFTGTMSIEGGVLLVNGSQPLTFMAVRGGGTLGGAGTVGGINVQSGGRVSPGSSPGILSAVQGVAFAAGGILQIELNGLPAGAGHDQFHLLNSIQLGNAALQVTLGFIPSMGDNFTIVNKESAGAISGIFQGLPEGTVFSAGGVNFRITYTGGTGNDVVLTRIQVPASTLSSIRTLTSERMQILGQGVPFMTYILEFSPHLNAPIPWTPIATNTANNLGIYEFIEPYADNGVTLNPARFYRVQSP